MHLSCVKYSVKLTEWLVIFMRKLLIVLTFDRRLHIRHSAIQFPSYYCVQSRAAGVLLIRLMVC